MRAYRKSCDLPSERKFKAQLGRVIMFMRAGMTEEVRCRPFSRPWGTGGRLIRNAHLFNAVERQDHDLLHDFHRDYWSSSVAAEFFDHFSHRFEEIFLRHHAKIVDEVSNAIDVFGTEPARVVELGPGDGRVLEYLSHNLTSADEFYGIDLNGRQIRECQVAYRRCPKLRFRQADILEWIEEHGAPGKVFFTNGGVCEYLTREQLLELFTLLRRRCAPCVIAITETLAVDHDLHTESQTWPYGHELAFSHNYPAILREAGFDLRWVNDRFTEDGEEHHPSRWIQLVAVSGA